MTLEWLSSSSLAQAKPLLAALALPPVPWLVLALAGAWLARTRLFTGRLLVVLACIGLWLGSCAGSADWMERRLLREPPALTAADRAALKARHAAGVTMAIVVLGAGVNGHAAEYGSASLTMVSLARLRYGAWLARQTGIPLGASGGRGWAVSNTSVAAEADLMAAIARTEFGQPMTWIEADSRDTHENARGSIAFLHAASVKEVLIVTNGWHMPRAMREFEAAAAAVSPPISIRAAPLGQGGAGERTLLNWMPSGEGASRNRAVLHEVLGALVASGR